MSKIDAMRADDEQVNDEIRQLEERIRESHLLGEL